MCKKIVYFLIIFTIFCSAGYSQFWKVDNLFEDNTIIVSGNVKMEVPADFATFKFTVKGYGENLEIALNNARNKIQIISKSLYSLGLEKKNLTTSKFYSGENTKNKSFLSSKKDFTTLIDVIVNIDNFDLLEPAVIEVVKNKPEELTNIKYSLKNYKEYRTKALKLALFKAKEKAKIIAKELSVELDRPIYIEEDPQGISTNSTNSISLADFGIS